MTPKRSGDTTRESSEYVNEHTPQSPPACSRALRGHREEATENGRAGSSPKGGQNAPTAEMHSAHSCSPLARAAKEAPHMAHGDNGRHAPGCGK
mmetsp:Transcript_40355/g.133575  ORF Transcript_40355/g.133575 Transcript_40355/m.133575 type:complete len:94 (+) Transcript_40355:67-348(+)